MALPHLEVLDLADNAIAAIPEDCASLHAQELILSRNRIAEIPVALADAKFLKILRLDEVAKFVAFSSQLPCTPPLQPPHPKTKRARKTP